jgi:hemerythrin-like domain-containing protein
MDAMNPNNIIASFLTTKHAAFCELFDEIDRLLLDVRTAAGVRLLSRLVEGLLSRHADVEQNLAYAALDHALAEEGELNHLCQDHEEIYACLQHATSVVEFVEAVRFLRAWLKASREHFCLEEETVFPLFEKLFDPAALEALEGGASSSASPRWSHGFENAPRGRLWDPEYFYQSVSPDEPPPTAIPGVLIIAAAKKSGLTMDDCI